MLGHYYTHQYLNQIKAATRTRLHLVAYKKHFLAIFEYAINPEHSCFNSSPYFCSHGGFFEEELNIKNLQIDFYHELESLSDLSFILDRQKTVSFTTITNPYWRKNEQYLNEKLFKHLNEHSNMIYAETQKISTLVNITSQDPDGILTNIHPKHRNAIRKFQKINYNVSKILPSSDIWNRAINELSAYNKLISEKGGTPKSKDYFDNISTFYSDQNCFIYRVCDNANQMLSSCLFFKHGETLEYWTPIISKEGRNCNALQGLVFEVMLREANDVSFINMGGTSPDNLNLLRFKERFGGASKKYVLHNWTNKKLALGYNINELMSQNPYFYFWRK